MLIVGAQADLYLGRLPSILCMPSLSDVDRIGHGFPGASPSGIGIGSIFAAFLAIASDIVPERRRPKDSLSGASGAFCPWRFGPRQAISDPVAGLFGGIRRSGTHDIGGAPLRALHSRFIESDPASPSPPFLSSG